jgi:hypothetical protein
MRRLIALAAMFSIPACGCFEDAYTNFCNVNPGACDGGTTGGGSQTGGGQGGGTGPGGGAALGGGAETGGGAATGGGSAMPDSGMGGGGGTGGPPTNVTLGSELNMATVDAWDCKPASVSLTNSGGSATATSDTSVNVSSSLCKFYSDSGCNQSNNNTVVITAGMSTGQFFYQCETFGTGTVTATAPGTSLISDMKTVTSTALVELLPPSVFGSTTCATGPELVIVSAVTGNPSATASAPLSIKVKSDNANLLLGAGGSCTASTFSVNLATGMGGGQFMLEDSSPVGTTNNITVDTTSLPSYLTVDSNAQVIHVMGQCLPPDGGCTVVTDCCSNTCSGGHCG